MKANHEASEKSRGAEAREWVMEDLQVLARDAEDLLKATTGDLSEKANEARARVVAVLKGAKATYRYLQEQAAIAAKAAAKKADTLIRDRRCKCIRRGFGNGRLIAVLVARR